MHRFLSKCKQAKICIRGNAVESVTAELAFNPVAEAGGVVIKKFNGFAVWKVRNQLHQRKQGLPELKRVLDKSELIR